MVRDSEQEGAGRACLARSARIRRRGELYPRPTNGILVAITFMDNTLASKGRFAM